MNAFLLSLGIVLVMLLTGAVAAPFFIDWSSQRHFFETHAAEVLGRPVEFRGPMDVRLVPFPRLTASNVSIGGPEGRQEAIERVSITAALTPLLSGELEISEIVLTRPSVTLALDSDGGLTWAAGRSDRSFALSAERTRLQRFQIVEGTVVLDGAFGGGQREMTGVNVTGSAGSLAGPFRLEGGGMVDGQRYSLRLGTGRLREDGAMRFTASIVPAGRAFTVELDGALEVDAGRGTRYRGRAVIAQPADNERLTAWRVEGDVTATAQQISADDLSFSIGSQAERHSLSGTATLELDGPPTFAMALSTRQLDFDRVYGGGAEDPVSPAVALARINELLEATASLAPGELSLEVDSVVVAGNLIEQITAHLELGSSGWRIVDARAQGPGLTDARFSGLIERIDGESTVSGDLRVETRQARALSGWLFGPDARLPALAAAAGHISAESRITVRPGFLRFSKLEMEASDKNLTGEIVYSSAPDTERPELVARIETDRLSLDHTQQIANPLTITDLYALLGPADVDLAIDADVVQAGAVEANDVTLVIARSGEDLRVDRLRVGRLGGARIDGYGHFSEMTSAPSGTMALEVEAGSLHGVAAMLAELGLPEVSSAIALRADALAPLAASVSVDATRIDTAISRAAIEIAGSAGGTQLEAAIGFEGRADQFAQSDFSIFLEAENHDGHRLFQQVGLFKAANSPGMGRIKLTAGGRPDTAMEYSLDAAGPGLDGRSQGELRFTPRGGREISGSFEIAVEEPEALIDSWRVHLPPGTHGPLSARGRLTADGDLWRLSDLTATAGDGSARGTLSLDFGGAAPVAEGELELAHLDLQRLAGLVLGPDAVLAAPRSDAGSAWPGGSFSPADFSDLRARLRLSAPQLDIAEGIHARRAGLELRISPGRLGLENIHGNIWGGQLAGELELAALQGAVQLEGRMKIERAKLEEFSWRNGNRAVAAGTLSTSVELSASGRNMEGLVSSLSGGGSIRVEDGVIRHMNPRAFERILEAADDGLSLEEDDVAAAFKSHLDAGSLRFERAEGSFSLAEGIARTRNVRLDGAPISTFVSASIDLSRMEVDSQWALRKEPDSGEERIKEVDILFAGPLEAPHRQLDVTALLGRLTIRAYEREVERLEELQSTIRSRQTLRQDITRFQRAQERFEREREERIEDDEAESAALETLSAPIVEAPGEPDRRAFEQRIRDALGDRPEETQLESQPASIIPDLPSRPLNIVPPFAVLGEAAPPRQ